jgi:hypothetical protein
MYAPTKTIKLGPVRRVKIVWEIQSGGNGNRHFQYFNYLL